MLLAWLGAIAIWLSLGLLGTGIMCAVAFLVIGMFIDAIPAIIIMGTVLFPVTQVFSELSRSLYWFYPGQFRGGGGGGGIF